MRIVQWPVVLLILAASPVPGRAQPQVPSQRPAPPNRPDDRSDRRVARLMDRLREEMWSYRQELEFFRQAPEYQQLVDLRYQLRNEAVDLAEAREIDPQVQKRVRAMVETARNLYVLTGHLEDRTDLGQKEEVRRLADKLRERTVEIRILIGRLQEIQRMDFDDRPGPRGDRR